VGNWKYIKQGKWNMFKKRQAANVAMVETQQEMESLMNQFEKQVFSSAVNDVTVELFGTMEVKSISSPEKMLLADFNTAYAEAIKTLKKARAIALVKIRNNIQKRHRVDMSTIVPEMKESLDYLNGLEA
tara:strand:- start:5650 stop:6036 length:387 start_codon:yes stop_codon:yes gene_type:complete